MYSVFQRLQEADARNQDLSNSISEGVMDSWLCVKILKFTLLYIPPSNPATPTADRTYSISTYSPGGELGEGGDQLDPTTGSVSDTDLLVDVRV